jgi:6-phosphogluconolactonase (cycloisomerase 2 family)
MNMWSNLVLTSTTLAVMTAVCAAGTLPSKVPSPVTYVVTNDDNVSHNSVSFYVPGGTQSSPQLTFNNAVDTGGMGIGGGLFGTARVRTAADSSAQCLYASDAGSATIAGIVIQTQQAAGSFSGSTTDAGDVNGIGLALNNSYLYAGYTTSNTIGTFAIQPGCQLSFLGDISATGLNGGSVAGMALHGSLLVVTYADGSIESFNTSNGIPIPNEDEQNSTGFASVYFPDDVDITQDGHFAIFGDSAVPTTVEVSDISSGKLTRTVQYTVPALAATVRGIGVNSGNVRLSPDESLLYIGNSQSGTVTAAFFDKNTGRVYGGCVSSTLRGFYNPWAYVGSLATRDPSGTGGVLYVAEWGFPTSSIGILKVDSNGSRCTLTESPASPALDFLSIGLLSIHVFPPRPF